MSNTRSSIARLRRSTTGGSTNPDNIQDILTGYLRNNGDEAYGSGASVIQAAAIQPAYTGAASTSSATGAPTAATPVNKSANLATSQATNISLNYVDTYLVLDTRNSNTTTGNLSTRSFNLQHNRNSSLQTGVVLTSNSLSAVTQIELYGPIYIPKRYHNVTDARADFYYDREILLEIVEIGTQAIYGNGFKYHYSFDVTDYDEFRLRLMPKNPVFTLSRPINFSTLTMRFHNPFSVELFDPEFLDCQLDYQYGNLSITCINNDHALNDGELVSFTDFNIVAANGSITSVPGTDISSLYPVSLYTTTTTPVTIIYQNYNIIGTDAIFNYGEETFSNGPALLPHAIGSHPGIVKDIVEIPDDVPKQNGTFIVPTSDPNTINTYIVAFTPAEKITETTTTESYVVKTHTDIIVMSPNTASPVQLPESITDDDNETTLQSRATTAVTVITPSSNGKGSDITQTITITRTYRTVIPWDRVPIVNAATVTVQTRGLIVVNDNYVYDPNTSNCIITTRSYITTDEYKVIATTTTKYPRRFNIPLNLSGYSGNIDAPANIANGLATGPQPNIGAKFIFLVTGGRSAILIFVTPIAFSQPISGTYQIYINAVYGFNAATATYLTRSSGFTATSGGPARDGGSNAYGYVLLDTTEWFAGASSVMSGYTNNAAFSNLMAGNINIPGGLTGANIANIINANPAALVTKELLPVSFYTGLAFNGNIQLNFDGTQHVCAGHASTTTRMHVANRGIRAPMRFRSVTPDATNFALNI